MPNLNLHNSAVLIWLPEGAKANLETLENETLPALPHPNPEPWWLLGQAIVYAYELLDKHGMKPWIKTGEIILSPEDIDHVYTNFGNPDGFRVKSKVID